MDRNYKLSWSRIRALVLVFILSLSRGVCLDSIQKMAASTTNTGRHSPLDDDDGFVFVFDRREKDAPEVKIPTGGLFNFSDFKERVKEVWLTQN